MAAKKRRGKQPPRVRSVRNSQLWLSLLEDASKTEWPPTISGQKWRVLLNRAESLQACKHSGLFRTSPVFPVIPNFSPPDLSRGTHYLSFFCFDPAFPIIGRLLQKAPKELTSGLLFTTGLASILLIARRRALTDQVERLAGKRPRSAEVWRVEDGKIKSIVCRCSRPTELDDEAIRVREYESLPIVPRTTVDEFVASMAVLVPKVQLHIPSEVNTFVRLVALVNELVTEMVYVSEPVGVPPKTLGEYTQQQFANSPSLCSRVLHQNTDRLIQINAALSYVSTQALSGAVPILDRRSLIRRYSLLGVGTATLALTRIAHRIESAFAEGSLEDILEEKAGDASPLPGLDRLPKYDSKDWREFSINSWKGKVRARKSYPKLPYFSGRLGFREAEYTVSAAMQALAAGAGPEWSLLTVTHEMLHGHVRNLLCTIFQGEPNGRPNAMWKGFYDRFAARCQGHPPVKENLLDSLRAVILSYCCNAMSHGSLTRNQQYKKQRAIELPLYLLAYDQLLLAYEGEYRNISEIFVHVLDLHYFYFSCLTHYVPLIWRSWSTVPQVWADLRQYLLRTLLVVATTTDGTPYQRFNLARSRFIAFLEPLRNDGSARSSLIGEALDKLKRDAYVENNLFFPFSASLILVDLAHLVLTSSTIRGALNAGDTHFSLSKATSYEDWLLYDMADGFVDDVVISPTAYLADRIARRVEESDEESLEAKTAALFLACASHVVQGEP
jgi:hypothetical protein